MEDLRNGIYLGYTGDDYEGTAVLYARFSCHNQREVSIEDQLRVDNEYCIREKLRVVRVYYDMALSGRNDNRPDFQRMIHNAPESNYVVVYMFERFSRHKYDSPLYKHELEKRGVQVLSALEFVPDAPEGVLIEKIYEGQAAYYSLKLSRDVLRGMTGNAKKCMSNGYRVFGYDIDPQTSKYVINDEEAAIVREVFARFLSGETMNSISIEMARRGIKTRFGNPVGYNWVYSLIHNDKYIGIYRWKDVEKVGGIPAIVDDATFRAAQSTSKKRPKHHDHENWGSFPLTGKLICAICGEQMHGRSAKNRHGTKYEYYCCKDKGGCGRKPIRKDVLEPAICEAITAIIDEPGTARHIAELVVNSYQEGDARAAIKACKVKIKDNEKAMSSIDAAIEQGIITPNTKNRIEELTREHEALEAELGRLRSEDDGMTVEDLTEFLQHGFSAADEELLLTGFLNQIFLFDGYAVGTLNFRNQANELAEIRITLEDLGFERKETPACSGEGLPDISMVPPTGIEPVSQP